MQARQEIHAIWSTSQLDHPIIDGEVRGREPNRRKTKLAQCLHNP